MVFFVFVCISNFDRTFCKQIVETYQTPRLAMSDLGLYSSPMSQKKNAMLIRLNQIYIISVNCSVYSLILKSRVYFNEKRAVYLKFSIPLHFYK